MEPVRLNSTEGVKTQLFFCSLRSADAVSPEEQCLVFLCAGGFSHCSFPFLLVSSVSWWHRHLGQVLGNYHLYQNPVY
jgi:hypothetical protein